MSYTGTKSQSGLGTVVNINTGTVSTPVWSPIGEVVEYSQSGTTNKTDDATNLQSSAEEFIAVILSPGNFKGVVNRVSGDAGQAAVRTAFNAVPPTTVMIKVTLLKNSSQTTSGDTVAFSAIIEEWAELGTLSGTKIIKTQFSFKVTGAITFTAGT